MVASPHPSLPEQNSDFPLADADVRAVVRLLGEALAMRSTASEVKHFLMDGLCELTGADRWVWGLCCQTAPGELPTFVSVNNGGFSGESFAHFMLAQEHPDMKWLNTPFMRDAKEGNGHITRTRQQIDPEFKFIESGAYPLWKKADVGPILLSMRTLDERSASMVALYRGFERNLFSPRESRIAHIVLSEIPWLHEQGWPEDRGVDVPRLTPRQRVTLNLLLEGQNRKSIAAHLNISLNTVQGYIRQIYTFFGVTSHFQLVRRFQQGNGGDWRSSDGHGA
jgi:DNA-binding CsgD family transcriptional regulator